MSTPRISNKLGRRHPRVIWSRLKFRWPFLIWMLALLSFVMLYDHASNRFRMAGVIERVEQRIAPVMDGTVARVLVTEGEKVVAGQPLVEMDTRLLQAQLQEARAKLREARAERANEHLEIERQYARVIFDAQKDLASARLDLAQDEAELAVIEEELKRQNDLLARNLADRETVTNIRARRDALQQAVTQYPGMIRTFEEQLAWARKAQTTAVAATPTLPAEDELLAELLARIEASVLIAGRAGVVTSINYAEGEMVIAGQTAVNVVESNPRRVLALLSENRLDKFNPGHPFEVCSAYDSQRCTIAHFESMTPDVISLDQSQSVITSRVVRGRVLRFTLEEGHNFAPGEAVTLRHGQSTLTGVIDFLRHRLGRDG